jgi:sugar phosphate isomerase/epimerase
MSLKISVQLYTLRSLMADEPWSTLEKLVEAGMKTVEGGATGDQAPEWARRLKEMGLEMPSAHVMLGDLEKNFDAAIDGLKQMGVKYVVLPYTPEEDYTPSWRPLVARIEEMGHRVGEHDMLLCYHNHDFELTKTEAGKPGLDMIIDGTSGANVAFEIDTYWVKKGGYEPAAYLQKLAGRLPLVHFKDMGEDGRFTEVGSGLLDWDDLIESSKVAGAIYAVIENDDPQMDPVESVLKSRAFLLEQGLTD